MTDQLEVEKPLDALKARLAKNPGVVLETLQEHYPFNMKQIIEALPQETWKRIDGEHYIPVLQQLSSLGSVLLVTNTPDAVLEFKGPFPPGELSHGFYNLKGTVPGLHGHLRPNRCESVYFVERPFMKRSTASILFTNPEGEIIFKIFLGRDETGEICAKQLKVFHAMAQLQFGGAAA